MDTAEAIVNRLTDGLRALPTDYVTRVRHFLAEYLGNVQRPVPFGGRMGDFTRLDDWLAEAQAPPYALLAAPAGRGKSALLLRWCERLLDRADLAVVYFPVSIRFRTNLAGVAFPALAALLAQVHGEKLPSDTNLPEEVWRGLFLEYVTRSLPDGRRVVLVLDGIDEAADWSAGQGLFPVNPPPSLRLVLSARYLANDQDAGAWLQRLGWTRPHLARTLELYPLDRAGIASVLLQMGFPLDQLGTRVDVVSELHRLSEGDPLLVRLYVDDLWKQGEAVMRLQPGDLQSIRPGLVGYFERWWNDQRLLWPQDLVEREAALQTVLNLLAGALGPLSKDDLLKLAPDKAELHAAVFTQYLAPLARFVIGDGMHQGYVFSHPRLANYFLEERLHEAERQEVESRFLRWGKQTLAALNANRLDPKDASAYIVQYYGAHLERSHAPATEVLALVSNGWRRAWEKLDRGNAGFLGDSERAARIAEREDVAAISAGQAGLYLGAEIRSLLCRVSIQTMTGNLSPRLMREAVRTGVWTPAQGLASVRLVTDLAPRARELVALAASVPEPLHTDMLQEALDTVATLKDMYARLDTLVELAPGLTENLLGQVLAVVPTIEDEADRAGALVELVPALTPHPALLEKALELAQAIEEEEYLALALAGLAPALPPEHHARVLQLVMEALSDERYRSQTLTALIPHFSVALLLEILPNARLMQDGLSRVRLLTELVLALPEPQRTSVLQEALALMNDIDDIEYRVEILVRLAPCLPAERLGQALREVQQLWDEGARSRALTALLPSLSAEQHPALLQIVQVMRSEEYRSSVLLQLLPELSVHLIDQALDIVQATWDEGCRVEMLAKLAHVVSIASLPRLLELIQAIVDPGYRVWLMAELGTFLASIQPNFSVDLMHIFSQMQHEEERLQTLLAIVNRLSDEPLEAIFRFMLPQIFGFSWVTSSPHRRAEILIKLAARLPEAWLLRTTKMVQELGSEIYQEQVLVALAPYLDELSLPVVLDIVRSLGEREMRGRVLEALVSSLPAAHRGERVREMLQVLQVLKDESTRVQMGSALAEYLPSPIPPDRMPLLLESLRAMTQEANRLSALRVFAASLPEKLFEDLLTNVALVWNEEERSRELDVLAPFIPERSLSAFLEVVQDLTSERWRAQVLATLVAALPATRLEQVIFLTQKMENEEERSSVLLALITHPAEEHFLRWWEMMQTIEGIGGRVRLLGALAQRMPQDFFPRFWAYVQTMQDDEQSQQWVLNMLVSRTSERFFAELWQIVQGYSDESTRAIAMQKLAPHVPEDQFLQVFEAVQKLADEPARLALLRTLLLRAPERRFLKVFRALQALVGQQGGWGRGIPMTLASRIPERDFAQIWQEVSADTGEMRRFVARGALARHVPQSFFPQLWQETQADRSGNQREYRHLLESLAQRVPDAYLSSYVEAVTALPDPLQPLPILKQMISHLSRSGLESLLAMVQQQPELSALWLDIVGALIPGLSAEQALTLWQVLIAPWHDLAPGEILAGMWEAWQPGTWVQILGGLVPCLPEAELLVLLPPLFQVLRSLPGPYDRGILLGCLAVNVPEPLLPELLELAWSLGAGQDALAVLTVLFPSLTPTGWLIVVDSALAKTQETGSLHLAVEVLGAFSSALPKPTPEQLYAPFTALLRLLAHFTRQEMLAYLEQLAPVIAAIGGETVVIDVYCSLLDVGMWWP